MSSVVPLRSSSCQSPDLVLPRSFPSVLTTRAFDQSRRRWFGTCPCQPVPRGLPSSIKQLHTSRPFRPSLRSWRTVIRVSGKLMSLASHLLIKSRQENVAEQGRDHAPYTKGNFQFERTIVGWLERYALL